MKTLLIAALAATALTGAEADWVKTQGGSVVRDKDGRVTEVSLARTWATDNDVERLAGIATLTRLDLSLTYVSDRGIEKLQKFDKLEDLNLDTAEFITDAAASYLRSNKRLRRLNLRGTDVTDTSLAYLAELTGLRSLDISQTQITDVGIEHLASLAELEELDLGGDKISGVSLNTLKLLPRLKKLGFYGIQRRNAGLCWAPVVTDKELETISLLSNLEDLNIGWGVGLGKPKPGNNSGGEAECKIVGGTRVTDIGLGKVAKLKKLRRLDISGAQVTAAGLRQLESLQQLQQLSLWNIKALNDSVAAVLAGLPHLTTLDLSYTAAGDETCSAWPIYRI
jgi:internalin A